MPICKQQTARTVSHHYASMIACQPASIPRSLARSAEVLAEAMGHGTQAYKALGSCANIHDTQRALQHIHLIHTQPLFAQDIHPCNISPKHGLAGQRGWISCDWGTDSSQLSTYMLLCTDTRSTDKVSTTRTTNHRMLRRRTFRSSNKHLSASLEVSSPRTARQVLP